MSHVMRALSLFFVALVGVMTLTPLSASAAPDNPPASAKSAGSCGILFFCNQEGKAIPVGVNSCAGGPVLIFIFSTHDCLVEDTSTLDQSVTRIAPWTFNEGLLSYVTQINTFFRNGALEMAGNLLEDKLASSGSLSSPIVSCNDSQLQSGKTCDDRWWLSQIAMMRTIALYLVVPLIMLAVIQSIVRGSMFFLLRAVFVMLPIAVFGSVVFLALAQVLMNISDDMAHQVASWTVSVAEFNDRTTSAIDAIKPDTSGFFAILWLILFTLACLGVVIELILRDVGIYLSLLFMPLAFAAMVWPPASRYLRRMVELVIGLIFSKVFIIGAMSLGFAAFSHASERDGFLGPASQISMSTIVVFTAGFAGAKILAITPAALSSSEGYVFQRDRLLSRGTALSAYAGRWASRQGAARGAIRPGTGFSNP